MQMEFFDRKCNGLVESNIKWKFPLGKKIEDLSGKPLGLFTFVVILAWLMHKATQLCLSVLLRSYLPLRPRLREQKDIWQITFAICKTTALRIIIIERNGRVLAHCGAWSDSNIVWFNLGILCLLTFVLCLLSFCTGSSNATATRRTFTMKKRYEQSMCGFFHLAANYLRFCIW